jgi:hypothetical protein
VSIPLLNLVWAALPLVIPVAIVLGYRRPTGPAVVTACAAIAAFLTFWMVLGGIGALEFGGSGNLVVHLLMLIGGLLLLIATWTICLTGAALARHWRWLTLHVLAGYLSFVAVLTSIAPPNPCFFASPSRTEGFVPLMCTPASQLQQLLIIAGYFAAPAAALVYALRAQAPRAWPVPEGLTDSPVGDLPGPDADADADADIEVRRERL